jgi:hypothetical protein
VGNLSAHALHFARFKRKSLGASKYSHFIFERFICVFVSFFLLTKKLLTIALLGRRGRYENVHRLKIFIKLQLLRNLIYRNSVSDSDGNVQ